MDALEPASVIPLDHRKAHSFRRFHAIGRKRPARQIAALSREDLSRETAQSKPGARLRVAKPPAARADAARAAFNCVEDDFKVCR